MGSRTHASSRENNEETSRQQELRWIQNRNLPAPGGKNRCSRRIHASSWRGGSNNRQQPPLDSRRRRGRTIRNRSSRVRLARSDRQRTPTKPESCSGLTTGPSNRRWCGTLDSSTRERRKRLAQNHWGLRRDHNRRNAPQSHGAARKTTF